MALSALTVLLAACGGEVETAAPEPRPVRTVTVEKREAGVPVTLTGRIEAEDEVALGFRIAGRMIENDRQGRRSGRARAGDRAARVAERAQRAAAAKANLAAARRN